MQHGTAQHPKQDELQGVGVHHGQATLKPHRDFVDGRQPRRRTARTAADDYRRGLALL